MTLLDHRHDVTATDIYIVLQAAYRVEAGVIGSFDFPPLKRTSDDISKSTTQFYGLRENGKLVAVAEVNTSREPAWLDAVAVHPKYFRRGFASRLLREIWKALPNRSWRVQTSALNGPALQFYRTAGFLLDSRFRTDCGFDMVVLRR